MIDNANGKLANIIPDNAKEFPGHTYIKIENSEVDLKEAKTFEDGMYKLYMEGTTLKAYTQAEIDNEPRYRERLYDKIFTAYGKMMIAEKVKATYELTPRAESEIQQYIDNLDLQLRAVAKDKDILA